jgi:thiosulfate reductase cytochrome b subunit
MNQPTSQTDLKSKRRWWFSITGFLFMGGYVFSAISIWREELIIDLCGLGTVIMLLPALPVYMIANQFGIKFNYHDPLQVFFYLGISAFIIYFLGTGLENLVRYCVRRLKRLRGAPK